MDSRSQSSQEQPLPSFSTRTPKKEAIHHTIVRSHQMESIESEDPSTDEIIKTRKELEEQQNSLKKFREELDNLELQNCRLRKVAAHSKSIEDNRSVGRSKSPKMVMLEFENNSLSKKSRQLQTQLESISHSVEINDFAEDEQLKRMNELGFESTNQQAQQVYINNLIEIYRTENLRLNNLVLSGVFVTEDDLKRIVENHKLIKEQIEQLLNTQIEDGNDEVDQLRSENKKLMIELSSTTESLKEHQSRLSDANKRNLLMSDNNHKLELQVIDLQEVIAKLRSNDKEEKQLNSEVAMLRKMESEFEQLTKRLKDKDTQIHKLNEYFSNILQNRDQEISDLKEESENKSIKVSSLLKETFNMQKKLNSLEIKDNEAKEQLVDTNKLEQSFEETKNQLLDNIAQLRAENTNLIQKLKEPEKLPEVRDRILRYTEKINELEEENNEINDKLTQRISRLIEENSSLNLSIQAFEKKIQETTIVNDSPPPTTEKKQPNVFKDHHTQKLDLLETENKRLRESIDLLRYSNISTGNKVHQELEEIKEISPGGIVSDESINALQLNVDQFGSANKDLDETIIKLRNKLSAIKQAKQGTVQYQGSSSLDEVSFLISSLRSQKSNHEIAFKSIIENFFALLKRDEETNGLHVMRTISWMKDITYHEEIIALTEMKEQLSTRLNTLEVLVIQQKKEIADYEVQMQKKNEFFDVITKENKALSDSVKNLRLEIADATRKQRIALGEKDQSLRRLNLAERDKEELESSLLRKNEELKLFKSRIKQSLGDGLLS